MQNTCMNTYTKTHKFFRVQIYSSKKDEVNIHTSLIINQ